MLSNLLLIVTLLLNSGAVLNFKLKENPEGFGQDPTLGDKVRILLINLQNLRVFLAIWNVFIMFCMVVLFS